ncbi:MAG: ComF family protein [Prosthecobacter sp.]|nr:ComF family protein [Prosthecobacter sp.]
MPDASHPVRRLKLFWEKTSAGALDGLYPRLCRHCEVPLSAEAPRQGIAAWLCTACQGELVPVESPYCEVCGEPFSGAMTRAFKCTNCTGRRIAFDFAVAGYKAEGPLRELIHHFKYGRDLSMRAALTELLLPALRDPRLASEELNQWLLVPVPLHFIREIWRGFNQSWELCRQISQQTGIPTAQILRRRVRTRTQVRLERKTRLANLRGAFALRRPFLGASLPDLRGKNIFLVDDVLTTGATAHECAKVLKGSAGVEKVVVLTAARG